MCSGNSSHKRGKLGTIKLRLNLITHVRERQQSGFRNISEIKLIFQRLPFG